MFIRKHQNKVSSDTYFRQIKGDFTKKKVNVANETAGASWNTMKWNFGPVCQFIFVYIVRK